MGATPPQPSPQRKRTPPVPRRTPSQPPPSGGGADLSYSQHAVPSTSREGAAQSSTRGRFSPPWGGVRGGWGTAGRLHIDLYRLLLLGLIAGYVALFSVLAFAQHMGMRTHKADLGQIAQAVWNSSRGRFVESTDYGYIATRMTDHVEPILALISPVLWVWDDVRALLLLQALAVGIGAWPLYELVLLLGDRILSPAARQQVWEREPLRQLLQPLALVLVVGYLAAPQLQSALLTEFHAVPLVVPLVLWALWTVEARRWGQLTVAVVLVASVKEETALLAALLGLWAVWRGPILARWSADPLQGGWRVALVGSGLALLSLFWFYLATFVIVPAHAVEVYGNAESTYFQRYGALGDSPLDILRSFVTQPQVVWAVATEPARLAYLRDLFMPFGWLALLAPEVILLGGPVLLANQLSAYPAQYYGEFHYSAPVAVYFAAAAAFGLVRLWRLVMRLLHRDSASFQHLPTASASTMAAVALVRNSRTALRPVAALLIGVWLVGWAAGSYVSGGRGPGGGRYDPTPITDHHRLLPHFVAQVPPDAAITATAAVHPHVSLRRYVYQFPIGLEPPGAATWALLDVTTATDMAPGDVRTTVEAMLGGEWGIVDGADGFLLLQKGAPAKTLPPAFYDFARTPGQAGESPLTLVDARVDDWPRWRATRLVSTWQVGTGFDPATLTPGLEVRSPGGEVLARAEAALTPAWVWYPPDQWQVGDMLYATTLPFYLPTTFGLAVHAAPGLSVEPVARAGPGARVVAASTRTAAGSLAPLPLEDTALPPAEGKAEPVTARFELGDGTPLTLTAQVAGDTLWPGGVVNAWLMWEGEWPRHLHAFVHLRQGNGTVAQQDGPPRYFVLADVAGAAQARRFDWREMAVPAETDTLAAGPWRVVVGVYDPATGVRFPVVDGAGMVLGDEVAVAYLTPRPPPVPDQSCALIPATCASQVPVEDLR